MNRAPAMRLADATDGPSANGDRVSHAIEVHQLVRRFGEVEAVRGVSFEVEAGETFGFLGPNGAGKSTTISMLCTLLRPTSGSARVAGFDVATQQAEVRKRIGLVFQDT
ncbi:MAG TPA: ATP-binding cassette domain-containing protein, partial [Acidimicrobiales bacterium]|nr:ATP-binding cassette domain-containing protein [Acidimicrobiales bacterium]